MPMAAAALHIAVLAAVSCASLVLSVSSLPPAAAVFKVGDERGWTVPANGTETYNHWAKRNRFQAGDVLSFKYAANDSVLLVSHDGYKQCSTETPLSRFTGGDTKFTLDGRYAGPVYFVSGVPGHCEAGQRMIVRLSGAPRSGLYGAGPAAAPPGMPPTTVGGGGGAPSSPPRPVVVVSPPAVPSVGSGSASASAASPAPSPEASGASRRVLLGAVVSSSVAVGIVVLGAIASTLSVIV